MAPFMCTRVCRKDGVKGFWSEKVSDGSELAESLADLRGGAVREFDTSRTNSELLAAISDFRRMLSGG